MKLDTLTSAVKSVAMQMGIMSAFVAVDETVRTFVKEKVRPLVRVRGNNDSNR